MVDTQIALAPEYRPYFPWMAIDGYRPNSSALLEALFSDPELQYSLRCSDLDSCNCNRDRDSSTGDDMGFNGYEIERHADLVSVRQYHGPRLAASLLSPKNHHLSSLHMRYRKGIRSQRQNRSGSRQIGSNLHKHLHLPR